MATVTRTYLVDDLDGSEQDVANYLRERKDAMDPAVSCIDSAPYGRMGG